jgi:hypothetical protein
MAFDLQMDICEVTSPFRSLVVDCQQPLLPGRIPNRQGMKAKDPKLFRSG